MAFCTQCGSSLPSGTKFCTSCGAAQTGGDAPAASAPAAPQPVAQPAPQPAPHPVAQPIPQPAPQAYPYPYAAPQPYLEEPISTGSYVGIFLVLMIPVINLLCLLIWACGGCGKRNLTYLSRAMLVWMLISAVIGGLMMLAFGVFLSEHMESMKSAVDEFNKMAEQYQTQG